MAGFARVEIDLAAVLEVVGAERNAIQVGGEDVALHSAGAGRHANPQGGGGGGRQMHKADSVHDLSPLRFFVLVLRSLNRAMLGLPARFTLEPTAKTIDCKSVCVWGRSGVCTELARVAGS